MVDDASTSVPAGIDPGDTDGWRDTVINWEGLLERVIDDYGPHAAIDHAVQKDGIQNAWDARISRRGTDWRCELELLTDRNGHRFLTITDYGTTGLTGRVLQPNEYSVDMPEQERWARFESLAFTHGVESADTLGARGQGKFIFVAASKSRLILYDSRRPDGSYRLGARKVERIRSPVKVWEGPKAETYLSSVSPDLSPLGHIGTRVIIDDPLDEIADAMLSGRMCRHIAETWWPIIRKYGADIRVVVSDRDRKLETRVEIPDDLKLPEADSERYRVWLRENQRLPHGSERYLIKRLHVVHDSHGPVAPEIQGVALLRGGMVVMRLPMRYVPASLAASITGYVEFDERLDIEMKRVEEPTHYAFNLRRGVGFAVKQWVEQELARFAAEKLGQGGERARSAEARRREAERRALDLINRKARQLGLVGPRGSGGGGGGGGGGGSPRELIAVQLDDPVLPRTNTRRIEFGEKLSNIRVRAVNNSPDDATVRLSVYLTCGDVVRHWFLKDQEVKVSPRATSDWTPPQEILFNPDDYLPGAYVLRAKLLVVQSKHRPRMYEHKDAFKFWVAEDPPQGGLFEDIDALDYQGDAVKVDAEAVPGKAGGWRFQYNLLHPAYKRVAGYDDELVDYLFERMARELVYVDLQSPQPVLLRPDDLTTHADLQRSASRVISDILYEYYGGREWPSS